MSNNKEMEKSDVEKQAPVEPSVSPSNNPLYCSYENGMFTYKDPNTAISYVWNETDKKWVVKHQPVDSNRFEGEKEPVNTPPGTSQVLFDGESYTYTDKDGTVFLWDSVKGAWFPKDDSIVSSFTLPPSPPDLSSTSTQRIGFFNPNYGSQLTSPNNTEDRSSRRFYYASLSPTSMGVNENPGLFLSPDDQANNNVASPEESTSSSCEPATIPLPPGWETHEDSNGPYYWHIKSGTIQRERPTLNSPVAAAPVNNPALMIPGGMDGGITGFVRRSNTVAGLANSTERTFERNNEKRRSWVNYLEDNNRESSGIPITRESRLPAYEFDKHALKFAAVSLGCLSICEEDLTPERSSRAVSKVIAELTSGGGGGGGKDRMHGELPSRCLWSDITTQMYLELTDSHLRVRTHRQEGSSNPLTLLEQPIHSIRVWGVGREDPRDFAFVAREKLTRQFLCHVFRLDMYARPLASSLRDACKKIMIERNARVNSNKRPTSLGIKKCDSTTITNTGQGIRDNNQVSRNLMFPTPMDEPRKIIKAFYLGSVHVNKPTGIDTLNNAIDGMRVQDKIPVLVSVAPSVIGITSTSESPPKVEVEVRVRFLSFMGIGTDIRTCGIIIHTARDDFEAHCFYLTPSTGALCKAIEAACVLRYQKCLDAHHPNASENTGSGGDGSRSTATSPKSAAVLASNTASNLASALKTVFSSFGKGKSEEK